MITDALRTRALELGVELEYEDVDQQVHDANPAVVERVVEILAADASRHGAHVVDPIHLDPTRPVPTGPGVTDAELLVDGTVIEIEIEIDASGRAGDASSGQGTGSGDSIRLPPGLPYGCHTLRVEAGPASAECTIVVAPPTMPDLGTDARASSVFAPAYAMWEPDSPLPSFRHLASMARTLGARGIDTLATLPLYATFLDEPFDPSPYSPISRLHWNEVYLDDDGLPDADLPQFARHAGGEVDWRELGARRRTQLVRAALDADDALVDELARFSAAHPDVGSYARFRAQRESSGDLIVERSHVLAQYLADHQLAAIADDPDAAGLSLDLPIGSNPHGWETWAHPHLFAEAMAVGAPPDTFFTEGQNWGFPPQMPGAMRASGYELWRQMLRRTGRHASMLRIDHVMAVHRLWWVPDGSPATDGVYVRYPHHELLAVIAAEAAAAGVSVVGENLGTVPPAVDEALGEWEMLGMYEEQFMLRDTPLPSIPPRSVAGVRTHDMAPFAVAEAELDTDELTDYRDLLGAPDGPLLDAVVERLAESDAQMIVVDVDDLLDETRPHNLPGRVVDGIWSRRFDRSLTDTLADPDVDRRLGLLERTT